MYLTVTDASDPPELYEREKADFFNLNQRHWFLILIKVTHATSSHLSFKLGINECHLTLEEHTDGWRQCVNSNTVWKGPIHRDINHSGLQRKPE